MFDMTDVSSAIDDSGFSSDGYFPALETSFVDSNNLFDSTQTGFSDSVGNGDVYGLNSTLPADPYGVNQAFENNPTTGYEFAGGVGEMQPTNPDVSLQTPSLAAPGVSTTIGRLATQQQQTTTPATRPMSATQVVQNGFNLLGDALQGRDKLGRAYENARRATQDFRRRINSNGQARAGSINDRAGLEIDRGLILKAALIGVGVYLVASRG